MTETDKLLEQLRNTHDVAKIETGTGAFAVYRRYEDGNVVEGCGLHSLQEEIPPNCIVTESFGVSRKSQIVDGICCVNLKNLDKNTLHTVCPNGKEVTVCELCEYSGGYTSDRIELIRLITKSGGERCLAICKCTMSSSWTAYRWYFVSEDGIVSERDLS